MMSIYGIDFVSAAGENLQTVWLGHSEGVALMIKDACGMYPSGWDGMTCDGLVKILENGIGILKERSGDPARAAGAILTDVLANCRSYPDARVVVTLG